MPLGRRDNRQRRRRVAAAGAAGAAALHKHAENKREGEEQQPEAPEAEATSAGQEASQPDDSYAKLTQLKSLLDSGTLTQEEFDAEKQKILSA